MKVHRQRRDARKDSVARTGRRAVVLTVRRAPGRSTRCVFTYIGSRSRRFMNSPGQASPARSAHRLTTCRRRIAIKYVLERHRELQHIFLINSLPPQYAASMLQQGESLIVHSNIATFLPARERRLPVRPENADHRTLCLHTNAPIRISLQWRGQLVLRPRCETSRSPHPGSI